MKARHLAIALAVAVALAFPADAAPATKSHDPPGMTECREHTTKCGKKDKSATVIDEDIDVDAGEEESLSNGTYVVGGNITVHDGGFLEVVNADLLFEDWSNGILVEAGGTLVLLQSFLAPSPNSTSPGFAVIVHPDAVLRIAGTTIAHATSVEIAADDALVDASAFHDMDVGLSLVGSDAVVTASEFAGNVVSVVQTGGSPTLDGNAFMGGLVCVRNVESNPTISNNTMVSCHTGIEHIRSHSSIVNNLISDDGEPPGAAVRVIGVPPGASDASTEPTGVLIEGNHFTNFGTGVHVVEGRAFIRNNTIVGNVGDGVRVERNAAPMDVRGNRIESNGGAGVRLVDAVDVAVADNDAVANAADGFVATGGAGLALEGNAARLNGGDGIAALGVPAVTARDALAVGNAGAGVRLEGVATATLVRVNASGNGADGFLVNTSAAGADDVALERPVAIGNGRDGLRNAGASGVVVTFGWFEGNGAFGARTLDAQAVVTAPLSWWGSATGPFHPVLNPVGGGDAVSDGVVFLPYLPAPPN